MKTKIFSFVKSNNLIIRNISIILLLIGIFTIRPYLVILCICSFILSRYLKR